MRVRPLLLTMTLLAAPMAFGGSYSLNDWCFYVNTLDLNHSCSDGSGINNFMPSMSPGSFDYVHLTDNTLGTVAITLGPGTYSIFGVYDYNISPNGTSDYATVNGNPGTGQVYTVGSGGRSGDVFTEFAAGNLDNTNHDPSCATPGQCDNVSVSIGFNDIVVPPGSTGTVNLVVSDTPPPGGGFNIGQTDGTSGGSLFISGNVQISGGLETLAIVTPEPGSMMLISGGLGLMLCALRGRRKA